MGQSGLEMGQHIFAKILTKNVCTVLLKAKFRFSSHFRENTKHFFFIQKIRKLKCSSHH